jgi:membrane fusion protein, copper/silver efflux system
MRIGSILGVLTIGAAAGVLGWYFGRQSLEKPPKAGERKIAFYQSAMHPWIKSDKPGNCTICGMKLTPVFEGEKGFEAAENVVTLTPSAINVINVQTEAVQRRALERTLQIAGRIESDETRKRVISAYVDGRVEKLFINYTGAEVEAGDALAILYSPALLTAEREYLTALGQTNLAASERLAPEHQRLVEGARQRLKRLGLSDEQITELRSKGATNFTTQTFAPISGTVINRAVFEGQYVKEGDKLFEIADLSRMWFRFDVYEQDLPFIARGQAVQVTSPALGGKVFEGTITFIDPNINQASRSALVRVELENPVIAEKETKQRELYNGLYAEGSIRLRTDPVLAVSRSAVLHPGDHPRVFLDQGSGAFEHRVVKLGRRGKDFVEVLDGLSEGDKVVVNGNLLLDSQAQINRTGSAHQHAPAESTQHKTHATAAAPAPLELAPEQLTAVTNFLSKADALAQALAADNLADFNARAEQIAAAAGELKSALENAPHLGELAAKAHASTFGRATDLKQARTAFLPLSTATVALLQGIRSHSVQMPGQIYKCPMYPRPGNNAFWVQLQGPLRNPFYGAEMLDCGVEVK